MTKISERNLGQNGEESHIKKQKGGGNLNYKADKLHTTFHSFNLTN